MTEITTTFGVTVRFFAAARAAAGVDALSLTLRQGATMSDLVSELSGQSEELGLVLRKCSFLCDGVAVRGDDTVLMGARTVEVLPPFSGG